ncbi:Der GTPase-activating protein YihI [Chromatiaceae bacterium AAb-1]|nr:Der GTPase-activating protein YihI [Chromatiaceae bacterium AAb-1]
MTRQKKTRSSGTNGQRHLPVEEIRKTRAPKEESKKKGAGLKSGSRNSQTESEKIASTSSAAPKDKRLGSKKPVALLPAEAHSTTIAQTVTAPKATLVKTKAPALSPEQELAQIENDAYLQQLLERVENDEVLTGKDAKYFNAKTARLDVLLKLLGLDTADEEAPVDKLAQFENTDWRKSILGDDD